MEPQLLDCPCLPEPEGIIRHLGQIQNTASAHAAAREDGAA
jgi:hypothetical protein